MDSKKRKSPNPRIPQLTRCVVRKVEAEHKSIHAPSGLKAKIERGGTMELLEPATNSNRARVRVNSTFDGIWTASDSDEVVMFFRAAYEVRFLMPEGVAYEVAEAWMDDEFYRESILAQATVLVNQHAYAQLAMFGIDGRRPLGLLVRDKPVTEEITLKDVTENCTPKKIASKPKAARKRAKE